MNVCVCTKKHLILWSGRKQAILTKQKHEIKFYIQEDWIEIYKNLDDKDELQKNQIHIVKHCV